MDHKCKFTVEKMCAVLGVSTSGYYKWRKIKSKKQVQQTDLESLVRYEFDLSKATYGSPRITEQLEALGHNYSKTTIARCMKRINLVARSKRKFKLTTESNHDYRVFPNLLNRKFDVDQPGIFWVSDITYIRVASYWMYLTVVIDLADRMVLGWSLSKNMSATNTVVQAFKNACMIRKPVKEFLFHSDRGAQYACDDFTRLIKDHHGVQSMSRKGNCWDNAVAESFFKTLKIECIYKYKIMHQKQAYSIIFNYIDGWYNTLRRHSALKGLAPVDAFLIKSKLLKLTA